MQDKILGIQSWCFRNFKDNNVMLPMLKSCGVDAIELCGIHAEFSKPETFKSVVEIYKKHGVKIASIGVNGINLDEKKARTNFEFLKASGAKHMSVSFSIDKLDAELKMAEKLAEEYGVTLGIHNHGGYDWLGNSTSLRWVFSKCSKRIGLSLDTAWAMDAGEDYYKWMEEFKERLYMIHVKDFVFDKARKPKDVVVGTGNIDLKAMKDKLSGIGFKGIYIVEYEGEPEDPVKPITECVKNINKALF